MMKKLKTTAHCQHIKTTSLDFKFLISDKYKIKEASNLTPLNIIYE
jgi:hypothetical protein